MIFGPYMWLLIPGIILGIYAQIKLTSAYNRYLQVGTHSGLSGAEAAREILDHAGLADMPVEEIGGHLTDHYDPAKKALFLSTDNFHGRSISAVGVAAHEAGHALQQQAAYALFNLRMWLVPATQFASVAWMGILILGMFLGFTKLIGLAIGIFSVMTIFQLVTLPVEFDASRRAKDQLVKLGLVQADESGAVNKVLSAAALTYVAALVTSVMQLLQFVMIARNDRD
ncbi:MAG: flagellar biosynthesis anti-sigma factor FlgM [Pedosphaera sp.]|nr:flagellar biosynthesis anti-sigma factor FlgM [Pedosphaera sp.]